MLSEHGLNENIFSCSKEYDDEMLCYVGVEEENDPEQTFGVRQRTEGILPVIRGRRMRNTSRLCQTQAPTNPLYHSHLSFSFSFPEHQCEF